MRRKYLVLSVVALPVIAFGVREIRNYQQLSAARQVVQELDGKMTSLPFEPFGSEYFIVFSDRIYRQDELKRLTVLGHLTGRNTVAVLFRDTNISRDDLEWLKDRVPRVAFRRVDSKEAARP